MFLIASALGQKDITPETYMVNPQIAAAVEAARAAGEPDVAEDGTVSKETIAALARLIGAEPQP